MNIRPGLESAKRKAEDYYHNFGKTAKLLDQAVIKAAQHKNRVQEIWDELNMLIRMIGAWVRGEYRNIPAKTIISGLAALIYFVNPFDIIPDFIAGFGFLDDATVILLVFNSIRKDIDTFAEWYSSNQVKDIH